MKRNRNYSPHLKLFDLDLDETLSEKDIHLIIMTHMVALGGKGVLKDLKLQMEVLYNISDSKFRDALRWLVYDRQLVFGKGSELYTTLKPAALICLEEQIEL